MSKFATHTGPEGQAGVQGTKEVASKEVERSSKGHASAVVCCTGTLLDVSGCCDIE